MVGSQNDHGGRDAERERGDQGVDCVRVPMRPARVLKLPHRRSGSLRGTSEWAGLQGVVLRWRRQRVRGRLGGSLVVGAWRLSPSAVPPPDTTTRAPVTPGWRPDCCPPELPPIWPRSGPGPRPRRGRGCGPGDGDGRHRAPDAGTDSRRRPARSPCLLQLRDSASRSGRSSGLTRVRNAGRAQDRTEANQTWEAEWLLTRPQDRL